MMFFLFFVCQCMGTLSLEMICRIAVSSIASLADWNACHCSPSCLCTPPPRFPLPATHPAGAAICSGVCWSGCLSVGGCVLELDSVQMPMFGGTLHSQNNECSLCGSVQVKSNGNAIRYLWHAVYCSMNNASRPMLTSLLILASFFFFLHIETCFSDGFDCMHRRLE